MPLYRRPMLSYDVTMTVWLVCLLTVLSVTSAYSAAKTGDTWHRSKIIEWNSDGQSSTTDVKGSSTDVKLNGASDKRKKSSDLPHNLKDVLEENSRTVRSDDEEEEEVDDEDQLNRDYVRVARSANAFVRRSRRNVTSPTGPLRLVVDLLVVVDNELYRRALQRQNNNTRAAVQYIKKYYKYLITLVDFAYSQINDSELTIRVRQAGIFIAKNGSASPWSEHYADQDNKTLDYNVAIDTLQDWLKEKYATLPKFDHAMAFTGYDLTGSASGVTFRGTICQTEDGAACSIIEERGGLSSARTAIHELGHNLGADHDGQNSTRDCPETEKYVMAPEKPDDDENPQNYFLFSSCSIRQLKSALSSEKARCLFDSVPDTMNLLPGQRMSIDDQCKDFHGQNSGKFDIGNAERPPDKVCAFLYCVAPGMPAWYCVLDRRLIPVLGTTCGERKVCMNGQCINTAVVRKIIRSLNRFNTSHTSTETPLLQTSVNQNSSGIQGITSRPMLQ